MKIDIEKESNRALDEINSKVAALKAYIAALPTLAAAFEKVSHFDQIHLYPERNGVICRVHSREDWKHIRALRRGVWEREVMDRDWFSNAGTVVFYRATADCGTTISCFVSELPPTCRIVREEKHVEAHTEVVERVVCGA
jgi:hypothetical protein